MQKAAASQKFPEKSPQDALPRGKKQRNLGFGTKYFVMYLKLCGNYGKLIVSIAQKNEISTK